MTDVQELRARLANRQSFFGGKVSTREATTSVSWHVPEDVQEATVPVPSAKSTVSTAGVKRKPAAAAAPPQASPTEVKRQKLKTNRDFSGLDGAESELSAQHEPRASPPPKAGRQPLPKAHTHAIPAHAAASAQRSASPAPRMQPANSMQHVQQPYPRSKSATPPAQSAHAAYTSRHQSLPPPRSQATSRHHLAGSGRVIHAKGKKGAVARSSAMAPQMVGHTTRKEMANLALRQQINAMRPPSQTPPSSSASASISNSSAASGALRQPQAAAATRSGGPIRADTGGAARAQPSGAARSVPATTDARRPAQQGQRMLHAARQPAQRDEYDSATDEDDFVEDDRGGGDWRSALKQITGYDPSRFANERYDDRSMEASWQQIQAEEKRSTRMGRSEDEKAEQEELRRVAAKKAAKAKHKRPKGLLDL